MPDDELQVSIEFEEELSKGTKKIVEELERLERLASGGFGKATREAKKTEDQVEKTTGAFRRMGAFLGKLGKGAILVGVTVGLVTMIGLLKAASAGVRGLVKITTEGFRLMVRASQRAVQSFLDTAKGLDQIAKLAKQVGATASDLSAFRFIAELTGTSLSGIGVALRVGAKNILDYRRGVGEAADAFGKLGITQDEVASRVQDSGDLILLVAEKWSNLRTDIEKTAVAQRVFGRSGAELRPVLEEGVDAIQAYLEEAKRLGLVFSANELKGVEDFNDSLTRLDSVLKGFRERLVVDLAPALTGLVTKIIEGALALKERLKPQVDAVVNTVKVVAEFLPDAFRLAWQFVTKDSDDALKVLKVGITQAALGIGTVIVQAFLTAIKLVTNLFVELLPAGLKFALGLLVRLIIQFQAIQSGLFAKGVGFIVGLFEAAWAKIKASFAGVINFIILKFNSFVAKAQEIAGVVGGPLGQLFARTNLQLGLVEKGVGATSSALDIATKRAEAFEKAVRDAGDIVADIAASPFEVSPDELKKALGRALANAGPEIKKFFDLVISTITSTLDTALAAAKGASPAFAELVEKLKERLELARATVAAEAAVTDEVKKQTQEVERVKSALERFGEGGLAGLFGGVDDEGVKITGLLEEFQDAFAIGMEAARASALGLKDVLAGVFLDLTDESVSFTETLQNALVGILDLARNIGAELLSTLILKELLAAIEPTSDVADTAGKVGQAAALEASAVVASETLIAGGAGAGFAMEAGAAAASVTISGGAAPVTAAAGTLGAAAIGLAKAAAGLAPVAIGIFTAAVQLEAAAVELAFAAALLLLANAGGGGGGGGGQRTGGILEGEVTGIVPFARGGVARSPTMALFAEAGGAEAFVPLPDGRTIPVTLAVESSAPKAGDLRGDGGGGGSFTDARRVEINFAPVVSAQDASGVDDVLTKQREQLREEVLDILQNDGAAIGIQQRNADF
jgi:hypothetical protein